MIRCCRSHNRNKYGVQAINLVTLKEGGRRLGIAPNTFYGVAVGLGVTVMRAAQAYVVTEMDFERIKAHVKAYPPHPGRPRKKPSPVSA